MSVEIIESKEVREFLNSHNHLLEHYDTAVSNINKEFKPTKISVEIVTEQIIFEIKSDHLDRISFNAAKERFYEPMRYDVKLLPIYLKTCIMRDI